MAGIIYYPIAGRPSAGGQHVNVAHVKALVEAGFAATLLHIPSGGQATDFSVDAPLIRLDSGMKFTDHDTVVLPEPWRMPIEAFAKTPARKIIHCQNPFYIFHGFDDIRAVRAQGYHGILTCSGYTSQMLRGFGYDGDIYTIRPAISSDFSLGQNSKLQIAFMPRKREVEAVYLQGLFRSLYPQYASVPWVKIDGVSRSECADILRSSAIFASLSWYEGLGLPPLEAMACGAAVVGLHGCGGLDYANDANGIWVEEGDYRNFAHSLAYAITKFEARGLSMMRAGALETAKRYNQAAFEAELLSSWRNILSM
jgi:glycosyltransferase involved in cell wall biosynthesis